MTDQRILTRHKLIYYLEVTDLDTGQLAGHLADLTVEGILLVAPHSFQSGDVFHLRVNLPAEVPGKTHLDLNARCVWCRRSTNPDFFDAGFTLLDEGQRDIEAIIGLIVDFDFTY